MYTRLTNQLMADASKRNMTDSLSRLYNLQQKASTGLKYATASENPAIAAQGISLRSTQNQLDVYQNTMASTKTWLDTTDLTLTQITDTLKNAQNVVLQALNDTQGPDERKIAASAVDGYIQQLIDIGNTEDRGRYIFSGLKTDTKPFVLATGTSGSPVDSISMNMTVTGSPSGSITLNGISVQTNTSNNNEIIVNGTTIDINSPTDTNYPTFTVNGQTVIPNPITNKINPTINIGGVPVQVQVTASGSPQFYVAGSAININGTQQLLSPPNSVTVGYSGSAFVLNPPSPLTISGSVTGDANSLYVNGMKITVNTATTPFSFAVDGQTINMGTLGYENLSNVTKHSGSAYGGTDPAFPTYYHDKVIYQGDANTITRNIAPSQNMSVSVNGGTVFNPIGGMFDTLIKLRDMLRADDYISPQDSTTITGSTTIEPAQQRSNTQPAGRVATVFSNQSPATSQLSLIYGQLQKITNDVSGQLSINGNKLNDLQNAVNRADTAALEIKSQLSQNEEVNMAEAISDVNNQTTVYQAVINMSGRVQNMATLFDKI